MFVGREEQLQQLNALWRKRVSSLVTCRGRRRIGKSTLIERFAQKSGARFIKIEGEKPSAKTTREDELAVFATQLAGQSEAEKTPPADWHDAFRRLDGEIRDSERTVVLLDEVSWLAHGDKTFPGELKRAWDNLLKKHDRLILVLCGSVSSWIRDNIIDNSAFMGRRSADVVVKELSPRHCTRFWGSAVERIALREIFDVLSVTGGVPRYLEEIDPSLSADDNIRNMAFSPNSILRTDFDEMFADAITRRPQFAGRILRSLVDGPRTPVEIADAISVERGGNVTDSLRLLEESGFVAQEAGRDPETGRTIRKRGYRIRDNYSRFYLKCIEPVKEVVDEGAFGFVGLEQFAGWSAIKGLAFESLVVNNYRELLDPLHLGNALVVSAGPYRRDAVPSIGRKGVQVDLLLQTDQSLCLVEIKRRRQIGHEIVAEVDEKVKRIARPSGVSMRTALVYDGELAPTVEASGYFDAIIPARKLLGL